MHVFGINLKTFNQQGYGQSEQKLVNGANH